MPPPGETQQLGVEGIDNGPSLLQQDHTHASSHTGETEGSGEQRAPRHNRNGTAVLCLLHDADDARVGAEADAAGAGGGPQARVRLKGLRVFDLDPDLGTECLVPVAGDPVVLGCGHLGGCLRGG